MRPPAGGAKDVVGRITLAPDAGLVESLGAHHSLESAVADLVDNSIDAGATRVVVRLLTGSGRLERLEVLDNGRGMDSDSADKAMTIGHRREYNDGDLGHFGMGLKAASFAHADVLTLWSQAYGVTPVGRRIRKADFSRDFSCEVLSVDAARASLGPLHRLLGGETGTIVVWDSLHGTYRGHSIAESHIWLTTAETVLRAHLGVVFHRLLERKALRVDLVVAEVADAADAVGVPVAPIDPFGYTTSGHPGYPKTLMATVGGESVSLTCHIWPPRTDVTGFRIGSAKGEANQGFFAYRRDRLLQTGGWSGTATPSANRQLARVELDDPAAIGRFVTMNSEKQGLRFQPVFLEAVGRARAADGTSFEDFLADAEATYVEGNRRRIQRRKPAIRPDRGFAPTLRRKVSSELPMIHGDTMRVNWGRLPVGEFLDVDLAGHTVILNSRYRSLFAPQGGSLNDAPVVKALVYLLTHHVMEGQYLGAKDKDEIALWKSVLGAAVLAEEEMQGRGAEL